MAEYYDQSLIKRKNILVTINNKYVVVKSTGFRVVPISKYSSVPCCLCTSGNYLTLLGLNSLSWNVGTIKLTLLVRVVMKIKVYNVLKMPRTNTVLGMWEVTIIHYGSKSSICIFSTYLNEIFIDSWPQVRNHGLKCNSRTFYYFWLQNCLQLFKLNS